MADDQKATTVRLTRTELALLDAWVAYIRVKRERPVSRSEVISLFLIRAQEPEELSPEARAVRVAHQKAILRNE